MLVALFQLRFSQQATYAILNETVEACRALDKPHLTGLVNGVLRAAEREGEPPIADEIGRFSHPPGCLKNCAITGLTTGRLFSKPITPRPP